MHGNAPNESTAAESLHRSLPWLVAPSELDVGSEDTPPLIQRNRFLERENRRLALTVKRLERLIYLDSQTGLANRRLLETTLDAQMRSAVRTGAPLSLVLADIDQFKSYNDTFGHLYGDDLLRRIGAVMLRYCRGRDDLAARYGGDELVLLLPGVEANDALEIADRLRDDVASLPSMGNDSRVAQPVTVSVGLATFRAAGAVCCAADLIAAADIALYDAKSAGRNRTRFRAVDPLMFAARVAAT